jgi:hypothetical protein
MQRLAEEFRGQPVTFVGAYHAKPFRSELPWAQAVATARRWGVTFPLAYDRMWKTLFAWWLRGHPRQATSASFVIDADGNIAYVHPGPAFYPSDKPHERQEDADFERIRAEIRNALAKRKS